MISKENNNNKSIDSNGIDVIISHDQRTFDTIPFRLDFIKNILSNNKLEPIIDLTNIDTEAFTHPNGYSCIKDNDSNDNTNISRLSKGSDGGKRNNTDSNDDASQDIRTIINKKTHDFYKVINDIGGKLKYIKSGSTGHTFRGEIVEKGAIINYALKVVAYAKRERYGDIVDVRRPENAELMMIRLLSYFVVNKKTPHIVLPIGTFYTNIEPFVNLVEADCIDKNDKNSRKYLEFVEKYKKNMYHDSVSILISEWANRGDLIGFIRNYYKQFTTLHWKSIFFQILSVLAVIQYKFPSFRHNDLKCNNILVHKISQNGKLRKYTICKKIYTVPNIGYQIKLWDFDFACIPGIVENAKVNAEWTDEINVKPIQNRYYDMHYFFNTLIKRGFFPELMQDPFIDKEIKDFVNRIVPLKYQTGNLVSDKGRILINDEYLTPDIVLKTDPFFEEFRNYKPNKNLNKSEIKKYVLTSDKK